MVKWIFSHVFTIAEVLICLILLTVGIYKWLLGAETSSLVNGVIISVLVVIGFSCVRSLVRSARSGERCECCGDCSKCKIQCKTNEKYYGVQHHKK